MYKTTSQLFSHTLYSSDLNENNGRINQHDLLKLVQNQTREVYNTKTPNFL